LATVCIALSACGSTDDSSESVVTEVIQDIETEEETDSDTADDLQVAQPAPYEEKTDDGDSQEVGEESSFAEEEDEVTEEEFLPGYATEAEYQNRHTGSASLITEPTVLVSIFVDEEEDVWTPEEKAITLNTIKTAYGYIVDTLKDEYKTDVELIYDWTENTDLVYSTRIYESISAYVETQEERHIDELELEWVSQVPYRDLMLKYDTTSIAFLYFIPHEGCSYSSAHFIDDGTFIWNEGCLLYLQDMYSDTYDYETPPVYAHELLHLFGAEDYYSSADVFSKETYKALEKNYPNDIMLKQFDMINGVYTTYKDSVPFEIGPVTAYSIGIGKEDVVKDIPELIKEEPGCYSGSTFDRPF